MKDDFEDTDYLPGEIAWNELVTQDIKGSRNFYTDLLGWEAVPFADDLEYEIFQADGENVSGLMKAKNAGMPSMWIPYIAVEDIAATLADAVKLKATKLMGPVTVPTVGQVAVIKDPQGAVVGFLQSE